ncbi:hypothetical protein [Mesorhizobium sp. M0140]|uniref:hypothetical protein n=1 Tax=Mesorhizobium sp. M0140 TaxID=2956893 RepID=UPI003335F725
MEKALERYDAELRAAALREDARTILSGVEKVLAPLEIALERWGDLPKDVGLQVGTFRSPATTKDPVQPPLKQMVELLQDFTHHFRRPPGSGGKSRSEPLREGDEDIINTEEKALALAPYRAFTEVLYAFWINTTGKPFGHMTIEDFELPGATKDKGILVPGSEGLKFLMDATQHLPESGYTRANAVSTLEYIKRNRTVK